MASQSDEVLALLEEITRRWKKSKPLSQTTVKACMFMSNDDMITVLKCLRDKGLNEYKNLVKQMTGKELNSGKENDHGAKSKFADAEQLQKEIQRLKGRCGELEEQVNCLRERNITLEADIEKARVSEAICSRCNSESREKLQDIVCSLSDNRPESRKRSGTNHEDIICGANKKSRSEPENRTESLNATKSKRKIEKVALSVGDKVEAFYKPYNEWLDAVVVQKMACGQYKVRYYDNYVETLRPDSIRK